MIKHQGCHLIKEVIYEHNKNVSETIHIGSDFRRAYIVQGDVDLTTATAICKVRSLTGKLLATAECHIREDTIIVKDTLKISDSIKKGQYDVFIVGKDYSYKLVMGDIEFIHDISLH